MDRTKNPPCHVTCPPDNRLEADDERTPGSARPASSRPELCRRSPTVPGAWRLGMTNPLDLTGPEFLGLYIPLLAAAVAIAAVLRWALRTPSDGPFAGSMDLDPYEVAYLAGGGRHATHAALASLVQDG